MWHIWDCALQVYCRVNLQAIWPDLSGTAISESLSEWRATLSKLVASRRIAWEVLCEFLHEVPLHFHRESKQLHSLALRTSISYRLFSLILPFPSHIPFPAPTSVDHSTTQTMSWTMSANDVHL